MSSPQPLNYAPRVPWHANRTLRWIVVALTAGVLAALIGRVVWTRYLRDRLAFARVWNRWENFTEPPSTPIVCTDPKLVPRLLRAGPAGGYWPGNSDSDGIHEVLRMQPTWVELQKALKGNPYYVACAFIHSRSAKGQPSRIVCVEVAATLYAVDYEQLLLWTENFTWSWPPQRYNAPSGLPTGLTVRINRREPFTLYAGQPDPADASHFTIGYSEGGKTGTIDGRLGQDGKVTLTVRDGPLFGRPS